MQLLFCHGAGRTWGPRMVRSVFLTAQSSRSCTFGLGMLTQETLKPAENFYKNLFEANVCCGAKSQMLPKITVCSSFYAFGIKEGPGWWSAVG